MPKIMVHKAFGLLLSPTDKPIRFEKGLHDVSDDVAAHWYTREHAEVVEDAAEAPAPKKGRGKKADAAEAQAEPAEGDSADEAAEAEADAAEGEANESGAQADERLLHGQA